MAGYYKQKDTSYSKNIAFIKKIIIIIIIIIINEKERTEENVMTARGGRCINKEFYNLHHLPLLLG
jgi:hypothetical protein